MSPRELLHGDLAAVSHALDRGEIDGPELRLVLINVLNQTINLQSEVHGLLEQAEALRADVLRLKLRELSTRGKPF